MLGDELPGEFGGAVLEVLPHGEVAQHLEEREVARGEADLVDVVVRKHFWTVVSLAGGSSSQYGFSGCMPAVVRSTDGS